ncbi:MAG: hypothetical protein ABS951_11200 [Solibacillus sp.]
MWQQNLIMVLAAVLCWGLVIAAIMYTYKKQPDTVRSFLLIS